MEPWASVLVGYSIDVQPGEVVAITGGTAAEPLLRAVYREVITKGRVCRSSSLRFRD